PPRGLIRCSSDHPHTRRPGRGPRVPRTSPLTQPCCRPGPVTRRGRCARPLQPADGTNLGTRLAHSFQLLHLLFHPPRLHGDRHGARYTWPTPRRKGTPCVAVGSPGLQLVLSRP